MADVEWIRITIDMFDNRKIRHLRKLPEGNNIVMIWVMLLTMAGRCNAGGMVFLTENIPYTPKMLANELDFEENTVKLALSALEQLNMIVINNDFFYIAGWEEYQNVEGLEKIREQNRNRVARHREKQKLLACNVTGNVTGNVTVTQSNATEKEKEEELEKDLDIKSVGAPAEAPQPPEFGPVLQEAFEDWLKYKRERREAYKPTGLKSLTTQIKNQAAIHGEEAVAALIRQCMASNWKGIIFDRLQTKTQSYGAPAKKSLADQGRTGVSDDEAAAFMRRYQKMAAKGGNT